MKRILGNDFTTLLLRLLVVYAVLFLCRVEFYLMNTDSLGAVSAGELFALFRGTLVFDTASVLYVNGLFIFLSLLPFRFRERRWYQRMLFWLFTAVNSAVILLNLADSVYFHYAKKRFTADEFYFAGNDNNANLFFKFAADNWYLVILAVLLIWGMVRVYRRIEYRPTRIRNPFVYFGVNLLLLAGTAGLSVGGIRGGFTRAVRPITLSNAAQYATTHQKASLILSNPFCVLRTLGGIRIEVPEYYGRAERDSIFTPYHFPRPDAPNLGRRNIVVFTLESFSSEHSAFLNPDLYPDGQGYTPFLDSLMGSSYVFMNAYSNGRKSIDALPSVLASIPSYKKPFVLLPQALGEMKGLPRLLADEGYMTSFFCGSQRNSMGFAAFVKLAGVENVYTREDYEAARGTDDFDGAWGIWDEPFLNYMAETLSGMPEPFMASVFTLSSHHPFQVPEKYRNAFREGITRNHKPVQYTDRALRNFFEYAKTQPWYGNTIFVFTADHVSSEIFAEKTETPTGNSAIVMFVFTPDQAVRGEDRTVAQQMDLMPTLLGLVGYDKPYFAFGRDVFNEPERMPVATNYTNEAYQIVTDSVVVFSDGNKTLFAYDRADTLQRRDVKDLRTPAQQRAEEYLKAILQQYYTHLREKSYVVPDGADGSDGSAKR